DETTSYRGKIRLGFGSTSQETGDTAATTLLKTSTSGMNINLGAGMQYNRGKGRLRGIYGFEASIGLSSFKTTYDYNGTPNNGAILEAKDGSGFSLGVRGFVGAEYFFAPKISISGEFGWGIAFSSVGEGESTFEGGGTTKVGKSSS